MMKGPRGADFYNDRNPLCATYHIAPMMRQPHLIR